MLARLTAEWGVQPPPDRETHRAIFGERLMRKLTRSGVSVLGMRYHFAQLAEWVAHREERNVEVRWHPEDIGSVSVHLGDQRFVVGAVHPGFDGVSAQRWVAGVREMRASAPGTKSCERKVILDAIDAIEARRKAATRLAGLLVDDWSPERIQQAEERLFTGFAVAGDRPVQPVAGDGIGRSIPAPEEDEARSPGRGGHSAPWWPPCCSAAAIRWCRRTGRHGACGRACATG